MSAGIRSGVNWMRRKVWLRSEEKVETMRVFARPGNAFENAVAAAEQGGEELFDDRLLAHNDATHAFGDLKILLVKLIHGLHVRVVFRSATCVCHLDGLSC